MPVMFGEKEYMTFGINWAGNNGGSYSWGANDGDMTSTCMYGLWQNVSPLRNALAP